MNSVQLTYTPPRLIALVLGALIFVVYQLVRRPMLMTDATTGDPVPIVIAIISAFVMGYGLTMLGWLILRTKGQVWPTFKPTFSRIIVAFCLAFVTPMIVFSYMPWIIGPNVIMALGQSVGLALLWLLVPTVLLYPLSAMIIRHTYERRRLRFGLFCLSFWTAYAGHLLYAGKMVFQL